MATVPRFFVIPVTRERHVSTEYPTPHFQGYGLNIPLPSGHRLGIPRSAGGTPIFCAQHWWVTQVVRLKSR